MPLSPKQAAMIRWALSRAGFSAAELADLDAIPPLTAAERAAYRNGPPLPVEDRTPPPWWRDQAPKPELVA